MTRPVASDISSSLVARMDRLPVIGRPHRTWIVLLAFIFVFDVADINTFALAAPKLRQEWGLSVVDVGWTTSAAFFGMFLGALLGGALSDRYGRKRVLIAGGLFYSICSLLSGVSWNIGVLMATRVLTGVGIEAMTVAGLAFVAEMFPHVARGRYQALVVAVGVVGVPAMSWFSRLVVPAGTDGWRLVFIFGSLGAVAALTMVPILPESVRWLALHGRTEQAENTLRSMEHEAEKRFGGPLPEPQLIAYTAERPGPLDIFSRTYRKRTIIASLAWICSILGFYGFNAWTATLLNVRGLSVGTNLTYTSIVSIGAIPGALSAWFLADRFERKKTLFAINAAVAVMVLFYGFFDNAAVVLTSGFLVVFFLQCQTALLFGYTPDLFPTSLRGVGTGFANGCGRLAGVAGGYLVALIAEQLGLAAVFVYVAGILVLGGGIIAIFGESVTGRKLDTGKPDECS